MQKEKRQVVFPYRAHLKTYTFLSPDLKNSWSASENLLGGYGTRKACELLKPCGHSFPRKAASLVQPWEQKRGL